jgi:hypothetical protein
MVVYSIAWRCCHVAIVRHSLTIIHSLVAIFMLFCWLCIANNSQQIDPSSQHGQRASKLLANLLALLAIVLAALLAI